MKKVVIAKLLALFIVLSMVTGFAAGCKPTEQDSDSSTTTTTSGSEESDLPDYVPDRDNSDNDSDDVTGNGDNNSDNSNNTSNQQNPDSTKAPTDDNWLTTIPKELKGTTVIVANWGDESAKEYAKVATQFTKDTGINVKWVQYNQGDYVSSVVKQIAAGSSPDVVINNEFFPSGIEMVQPLTSDFNLNDGFWDKRFTEASSVNGKNYFVNSYNSPFVGGFLVYYNKKIFNDNGLNSPQDYYDNGKWTYENLKKCMQDVKKLGLNGGIVEPMVIAQQMGSQLVQYDPSTGKFKGNATDPNVITAMQFHTQCVEEGLTGGYSTSAFASGQIGLVMTGSFGLKYNGHFKDMKPSEIGAVPLPTSLGGKKLSYLPIINRGYGIAKGAKNPKGAYYFLRYFLDLDRYEKAGANIFANKTLEKYFVQIQQPLCKSSNLQFQYYYEPLDMIGKNWGSQDWINVRHTPSGQVAVELGKMVNICNDAANAANAKLQALAK